MTYFTQVNTRLKSYKNKASKKKKWQSIYLFSYKIAVNCFETFRVTVIIIQGVFFDAQFLYLIHQSKSYDQTVH